jgi:hypothetical protein
MGLDQYLHSTSIPQTFFIEAAKNKEAFDLVVDGFYYTQGEYNINQSYSYFRKSWPIDYLIKDNAVWKYSDEYDYCYYISPENALKIRDTCIRALRMFKPLHDLTDEEIIKADYTKMLDEIVYYYPAGSENYYQVIRQLQHIINIDSMGSDLKWEVTSLIDVVKLVSYERNEGNGLFYIRSY